MEIKFMTEVQKNMKIERKRFPNVGLTIAKIEELEMKFNEGLKFPKAFREFLFLAGDNNNFGFDDLGKGLDEFQNFALKEIKAAGQKVDRPFFAFNVYDSQYHVIFLDETEEDPKVYLISPFLAAEGTSSLVKIPTGGFKENFTFVEFVNESVRRSKYNLGI